MLEAGLVAHLGVITGGWPMVVPTMYGYDPDTLYLHGSVASQSLNMAGPVCVTITRIDGLVLARSVFEHTINYRSAMIYGQPRLVTDPAEWPAGLRCITEHASLAAGMAGAATDPEQSFRVTAIGATCRVRGTGYSFHRPGPRSTERKKITHLTCRFTEPVSGIEPLTCRLQEVWPCARCALPARMTRVIALTALAALGSSGAPFHEPFHAEGPATGPPGYCA